MSLPPVGPTELIVGITLELCDVVGGWLAVGDGEPPGGCWVGLPDGVVDGDGGLGEPESEGGGLLFDEVGAGVVSVGVLECVGDGGCVSLPGGEPEFLPGGRPSCGSDEVGVGVSVGPGWPGMLTGAEPGSPGSVDSVQDGCSVGMAALEVALAVGVSVGTQLGVSESDDSVSGPPGCTVGAGGTVVAGAEVSTVGSGQGVFSWALAPRPGSATARNIPDATHRAATNAPPTRLRRVI
jgi:hypothetical protein